MNWNHRIPGQRKPLWSLLILSLVIIIFCMATAAPAAFASGTDASESPVSSPGAQDDGISCTCATTDGVHAEDCPLYSAALPEQTAQGGDLYAQYLEQIENLRVQAEAINPASPTLRDEYAAINDSLMGIAASSTQACEAGELSEQEHAAIQKAIAAVSDLLTRNDSSSPAPEKAALQGSGQISPFQTSDQDRNYIIVQKTFSGITKEQIPADFQVTVNNSSVTYTLTQGGAANIEFTQSEDGLTWRWKILDATIGTYNVTESGMNIDQYTVTTTGLGSVEVKAADMAVSLLDRETTCSHTDWPVNEGTFFAATLTQQAVAVITEYPLSTSQREKVRSVVKTINGPWKDPVYFYSIQEQIQSGSGFSLNGATITYNFDTNMIDIGATSFWQHVATLTYDIEQAQNPEIAITNTYTKVMTDVTIDKTVSGNMGDRNMAFSFQAKVVGAPAGFTPVSGIGYTIDEGGIYTFTLKHGQSVTLSDLPIQAQLWIKELNATGYDITVTAGGQSATRNAEGWYPVAITNGLSVQVHNKMDVTIDTGIFLDSLPYVLILFLVAAGVVFILVSKRRKSDGD